MTSAEYRQALDALPYGKRLPGAVYLLDPGEDTRIPSLLCIAVAGLRMRKTKTEFTTHLARQPVQTV